MQPPPLPQLTCQLCEKPAEAGYSALLCSDCRTKLANRPFPIWIKIAILLVGLAFLYALSETPRSLTAAIAFERGQRAEAGSDFATAANEYAKVAEIFPNSPLTIARLGIAQYRAGDRNAAAETINSLSGRQAPKELTNEVNAVIAEMQRGSTSAPFNSAPTQAPSARPSSTDTLDRWIAENLPSATPFNSPTETASRSLKPGTVIADVGGTKINIPPPSRFFRVDGKSGRVDAQLKSGLASTNKLLAAFASDTDLAAAMKDDVPDLRRWLFAQCLVNPSYFTDASWARLKSSMRTNLEADMQKLNSSQVWAKIQSNVASISKDLGLEFAGANIIPLEVFDEDANSFCYTALLKSQFRAADLEKPVTVVQYEGAGLVYVRQRVIFLYSCAVFENKSDADWARTSLQTWRDAVVAANK